MTRIIAAIIAAAAITVATSADVVIYEDRESWEAAAGPGVRDIGFDEVPSGTWLSDEYADLGVHFEPWAQVQHFPEIPFDGAKLVGFDDVHFHLDEPAKAVGVFIPGAGVRFELFFERELLYRSLVYGPPGGEDTVFIGLTSSFVFDEVLLTNHGSVFLYDLALGAPIPAPASFALLAVAALRHGRRRRR
jgi:hypothetical protein